MSEKTVQTILEKALTNQTFAQKLAEAPEQTLAAYKHDLTDAEMAALQNMNPMLLSTLGAVMKKQQPRPKWWQPTSFKELGGSFLSLVLMAVLVFALIQTYRLINTPPLVVSVGGNEQMVDTFGRAQALLNMFFPLFSAVVTFWLGVAIEGRRADRHEAEAEEEKNGRQQAEAQRNAMRVTTSQTLGKLLNIMSTHEESGQVLRSAQPKTIEPSTHQRIIQAIQEAQQSLLELEN